MHYPMLYPEPDLLTTRIYQDCWRLAFAEDSALYESGQVSNRFVLACMARRVSALMLDFAGCLDAPSDG